MRRTCILLAATCAMAVAAVTVTADELDDAVAIMNEGWGGRAEAQLQAIAEREPKRAEVYYQLAWARVYAEDFEQAEKYIDRALELDPDNSEFLVLQGHSVGGRAETGSKLKAMGRGKKCRKCYERAIEIDPNNVEARVSLISFHLEAPGIVGGDEEKARVNALALAGIDSVQSLLMLARVYEQVDQDIPAAETALRQAVSIADRTQPENDAAAGAFIGFCYRRNKLPAAEAMLKGYLAYPEFAVDVRSTLGDIYRDQKKWDASREQWEILAAVDSSRIDAQMGLGYLAQVREQWPEAILNFETVYAADPTRTDALYQASKTRMLSGVDLDQAADGFRRYLAAERNYWRPSPAWAHCRLAETLWRMGDTDEAERELKRAKKLKGHNSRLEQKIKELEKAMKGPWDEDL